MGLLAGAKLDPALGGGNFMGQGSYAVSLARTLLGEPKVLNATMRTTAVAPLADIATEATLAFPNGVTASIVASALSVGFDLRACLLYTSPSPRDRG